MTQSRHLIEAGRALREITRQIEVLVSCLEAAGTGLGDDDRLELAVPLALLESQVPALNDLAARLDCQPEPGGAVMAPDYQAMADRLQEVVYDLSNMAAGAGTYPFINARELREIAAELDEAWDGNDW